jgi:serine/threonine-protein kinase
VGTANYLAPEQTQPGARADMKSDLYSLGVSLYEMLSGRLPFPSGDVVETIRSRRRERPYPLRRLRPELPAEIARLIESLLAKEPLRRTASADELTAQLTQLEVASFRLR